MKIIYYRYAALLLIGLIALTASCKDSSNGNAESAGDANNLYVGTWIAKGSQLAGYNHGNYTMTLKVRENGDCGLRIENNFNRTSISEKLSDIIQMNGTWSGSDDGIELTLKTSSWVVTDHAQYTKNRPLEDFTTKYKFRRDGLTLVPDRISPNMNIGTTIEARDMMELQYEGFGLIIPYVEFIMQ